MQYLQDIGSRIASLRKLRGFTQDELARAVGYTSRSSINKIEKGLVDIPQSKLTEIADTLQTTPAYLMGWEDTPINNSPTEAQLSEGEMKLIELFRQLPEESQRMYLEVLRATLKNQA